MQHGVEDGEGVSHFSQKMASCLVWYRRFSYTSVSDCNGIRACACLACDLYQLSIGSFSLGQYVRAGVTDAGSEINVVVNGLTSVPPPPPPPS